MKLFFLFSGVTARLRLPILERTLFSFDRFPSFVFLRSFSFDRPCSSVNRVFLFSFDVCIFSNSFSITIQTNYMVGALLNASFGSLTELILFTLAINKGALNDLILYSLTGGLLNDMLLIPGTFFFFVKNLRIFFVESFFLCAFSYFPCLGLSMIAGGIKYKEQRFNPVATGVGSLLFFVAIIGKSTFLKTYPYAKKNPSSRFFFSRGFGVKIFQFSNIFLGAFTPSIFYKAFGGYKQRCVGCVEVDDGNGNITTTCSQCHYYQVEMDKDPLFTEVGECNKKMKDGR